jgi:hypothetical protein
MTDSPDHSHPTTPPGADPYGSDPFPARLLQVRNVAGIVGVIGLALLLIGCLFPGERFSVSRGLLFGYWFWLSVSLGAWGFVMISHLTGGGWGVVMRRFGEAAALNIPIMLIFSVVLSFGIWRLFPWANVEQFQNDKKIYDVLVSRQPWYTPTWFIVRQVVCFAIWTLWVLVLRSGSLQLDLGDNPALRRRLRKWSAGGMLLFFVTTTSLAFDYILSRETNWYSSIIGFIVAVGIGLTGMSFVSLSVGYFADKKPLKSALDPQHLNDLGNILLALVILWMYTSFAQFLIQWNGNMPEDTGYYVVRGMGYYPNGWRWIALLLFLCHFLVPFFLLLMKGLKRKVKTLCLICGWLLVMRFIENLWVFAPNGIHFNPEGNAGHVLWTDFAAWAGVGGVWIYFYIRTLATQPLLVKNAADQPKMIGFEVIQHGAHAQHTHAV